MYYYYHDLKIYIKFIDKSTSRQHLDFNTPDKGGLLNELGKIAEKIEAEINYTYAGSSLVSKLFNEDLLSSIGISTKNHNFFNILEEDGFITFNVGAAIISERYYDEVENLFYDYQYELTKRIVDNLNKLNLNLHLTDLNYKNHHLYLKFET